MSILNQINELKKEDKREYLPPVNNTNKNNVLLFIAGIFSVLFSMSALIPFYSDNTIYLVLTLGLFLLFVLIFNEKYKVKSILALSTYYKEFKTLSINKMIIPLITVTVSLSSVYGLYTGLDTMIDINTISNDNSPQILIIEHQIDSLNTIQTFKTDSITKASNPFIKENVDRLSNEIEQLNQYQIKDKQVLLAKLEQENVKLDLLKKDLIVQIKDQIKELQIEKDKLKSISNKSTDNAGILKIGLALLAFITELVIIGTAVDKGFSLYSYNKNKLKYDEEYYNQLDTERKQLLEKPHVKKLIDYINILEMIYSLNYKEVTKKNIETLTDLRGKKYTQTEITEFRSLLIELGILVQHNNNKTSIDLTLDESKNKLDNFFSKIK